MLKHHTFKPSYVRKSHTRVTHAHPCYGGNTIHMHYSDRHYPGFFILRGKMGKLPILFSPFLTLDPVQYGLKFS
jgi:hypothetical protein